MSIIDVNRRLYYRLRRRFPHVKCNVSAAYPVVVGEFARGGGVIVDVGGGARCAFAKECSGSHIIAVDISASELEKNHDVSDRKVADVTQQIPVPDNSSDIVSSRYVLEHLKGVDRFAREAYRVLKPGGVFITLFPNKYAPFSLINRLLPISVARRVAYALKEQAAEFGIFPAYYERCSPGAFRRLLESQGFTSVDVKVAYSQSSYFNFLLPLALAFLLYESMISRLNLVSLSAHVLICARKPTAN
ncbi:MAG TPA: methyltransferase domain-containing protein [Terriglobales bacterium]|nr:methyltransferase domain-containing protein [Terriglobales bacterium]